MNVAISWRDAPRAEFCVIGHPIEHSLSPAMHNAALEALGLEMRYVAIDVPVGEVGLALERLRSLAYLGVNVTVPHKEEAFRWAPAPDELVKRICVLNTIGLTGEHDGEGISTDGPGFLGTLADLRIPPTATVLLLGAGGSARALTVALSDAGYDLRIHNRTRARAEAMVRELNLNAEIVEEPDLRGADLVVNATSASLSGTDLALDWSRAPDTVIAYDLMYSPERTPFLEPAARRGLRTVDGKALLVAQGALSLEWWLGRPAPRGVMAEAIR